MIPSLQQFDISKSTFQMRLGLVTEYIQLATDLISPVFFCLMKCQIVSCSRMYSNCVAEVLYFQTCQPNLISCPELYV